MEDSNNSERVDKILSGRSALLILDGDCALCHASGQWLAKRDKSQSIFFCTRFDWLEAGGFLPEDQQGNALDTVVFFQNGVFYTHSEAVLRATLYLGGICKLARIFHIVPLEMRNRLYNIIAEKRIRVFGAEDACNLKNKAEMSYRLLNSTEIKYLQSKINEKTI